jgi:hypothetical protein
LYSLALILESILSLLFILPKTPVVPWKKDEPKDGRPLLRFFQDFAANCGKIRGTCESRQVLEQVYCIHINYSCYAGGSEIEEI